MSLCLENDLETINIQLQVINSIFKRLLKCCINIDHLKLSDHETSLSYCISKGKLLGIIIFIAQFLNAFPHVHK